MLRAIYQSAQSEKCNAQCRNRSCAIANFWPNLTLTLILNLDKSRRAFCKLRRLTNCAKQVHLYGDIRCSLCAKHFYVIWNLARFLCDSWASCWVIIAYTRDESSITHWQTSKLQQLKRRPDASAASRPLPALIDNVIFLADSCWRLCESRLLGFLTVQFTSIQLAYKKVPDCKTV